MPKYLKDYGYRTSAFGKWHNTPALETTTVGSKEHWPNNYGFEYFYGFFGGATSQYEPRLFENYNPVEPPIHDETYHLTEDMTAKALQWLDDKQAYTPDQPFLMYWTPAQFTDLTMFLKNGQKNIKESLTMDGMPIVKLLLNVS